MEDHPDLRYLFIIHRSICVHLRMLFYIASFQNCFSCHESSEVDSHCSSVDSLLEARKPDPEEILLSLGFGGMASSSYLETGRVPKRFLNPSQLKGVDIEEFIREQQDLIYTFESGFYGYRGLAGELTIYYLLIYINLII